MTTPMRELEAYVSELPKLEAAASLRHAQEVFVGLGLDPKNRSSVVGAWRRAALGGGAAAVRRPRGQTAALARAAGIGVRIIPRRPPEP